MINKWSLAWLPMPISRLISKFYKRRLKRVCFNDELETGIKVLLRLFFRNQKMTQNSTHLRKPPFWFDIKFIEHTPVETSGRNTKNNLLQDGVHGQIDKAYATRDKKFHTRSIFASPAHWSIVHGRLPSIEKPNYFLNKNLTSRHPCQFTCITRAKLHVM